MNENKPSGVYQGPGSQCSVLPEEQQALLREPEEWKPDLESYTLEELAAVGARFLGGFEERFRAAEERTAAVDECLDRVREIRDAYIPIGPSFLRDMDMLIHKLAELKWGKQS